MAVPPLAAPGRHAAPGRMPVPALSTPVWLPGGVAAQRHDAQRPERQAHEGQAHEGQGPEGQAHEGQAHEGQAAQAATGVVLVAPFGTEDQSSHRLRRVWAQRLAAAGWPVLRLDLPGQGDSLDPDPDAGSALAGDVDVLPLWTAAVAAGCAHLRDGGVARVAVVGLGLGGIPAALAAGARAGVPTDLALWATPTTGRSALRQLRAFAALRSGASTAEGEPLWVNGFRLSAASQASLAAVDLRQAAPPARALLLGRDGAPPDAALAEAWWSAGAEVARAAGAGWTALVGHPQTAELPEPVVTALAGWLAEAPPGSPGSPGAEAEGGAPGYGGCERAPRGPAPESGAPEGAAQTRLPGNSTSGDGARERVEHLQTVAGPMHAVVTEPAGVRAAGPTLVLLNAGGLPHTGPNRLWVRAARAAAARGVAGVRLDLPGIGEVPSPDEGPMLDADFYEPQRTEQVRAAVDALPSIGLEPPYALAGLCSGAYWSFQIGQDDPRVSSVVLINPLALLWHQAQTGARMPPDAKRLLRWASWKKVLTGRAFPDGFASRLRAQRDWIVALPAARRAARSRGHALFDGFARLRANGAAVTLSFSDDEPLLVELRRTGQLEALPGLGITLAPLGGPPDSHSLTPPGLQDAVLAVFATALPGTAVLDDAALDDAALDDAALDDAAMTGAASHSAPNDDGPNDDGLNDDGPNDDLEESS